MHIYCWVPRFSIFYTKYHLMKKLLLFCLLVCMAIQSYAQELPYSKYLHFSKTEFKENRFKYHEKTNTWYLNKTSALNTTLNILAIIADAEEEVRPDYNDYSIIVQLGEEDQVSCIRVIHYNDEIYRKLLIFIKSNCQNIFEVSAGRLIEHQAFYGDYALELKMEQNIISRTSARTADPLTVKNVDESYNEYEFVIRTGVEPWSKRLEKQAKKQAKRDAKGKKKLSVEDLM